MIVGLLVATAALYGYGLYRLARKGRRVPALAAASFFAGLAVLAVALTGPLDERADLSFAWHMVQHLAVMSLAAPLLVLGASLRVALGALPAGPARGLARAFTSAPARLLTQPVFAWLQFATVLYVTHWAPIYERALESNGVHALLHLAYLASALLFWTPILAVAPAPHAPAHPVRLLALFLAIPMTAFLGFAFYVTKRMMYPHYATQAGALYDQMNAGAVMWLAGGTPLLVALLWVVADWGARERRLELFADGPL